MKYPDNIINSLLMPSTIVADNIFLQSPAEAIHHSILNSSSLSYRGVTFIFLVHLTDGNHECHRSIHDTLCHTPIAISVSMLKYTVLDRLCNIRGGGVGVCWSINCLAHFSTQSFHCIFIMISMKNSEKNQKQLFYPPLVSMEMAAIFDFRALTKIRITFQNRFFKCSEKLDTPRRHINEETYKSVFSFVKY